MKLPTLSIAASMTLFAACSATEPEDTQDPEQGNVYQTTSNVGDLSTWTIDGDNLHVDWQDIAPFTGEVERTYSLNAICGSVNVDYGYRTCLIDGNAECAPGVSACLPEDVPKDGDTLQIYEVPGVALVVNANNDQLHAGFAAGNCADVSTDDYTFVNVGLGQRDVFGMFRTNADFSDVYHMDFGFTDAPNNELVYNTTDLAGKVSGITASPCENGVRELVVDSVQEKLRMVLTQAGHFILDKPEGQGGLIAINSQNAAVAGDFANKEFGGIAFPDDRGPEFIKATTGGLDGGRVLITSLELSESGVIPMPNPVHINDGTTGSNISGAFLLEDQYDANAIVIGGGYTGGPSELPGLFELDLVSGDETAIIGVGATVNGKTILFGSVVNEFEAQENGVKGNFILVER